MWNVPLILIITINWVLLGFVYLHYGRSCLLLINSFETSRDQRQVFLSCAGRQISPMGYMVLICIKQGIRMRIVALDYTATVVISFSTIFQDTFSPPESYSCFQHALNNSYEDLLEFVLLLPNIVRWKIRATVRLSGTVVIFGISFIQLFCRISNIMEATYKRYTSREQTETCAR